MSDKKIIEKNGFIIAQCEYNHHIAIFREDDDKMYAHISCTVKKTDEELRDILDSYVDYYEGKKIFLFEY